MIVFERPPSSLPKKQNDRTINVLNYNSNHPIFATSWTRHVYIYHCQEQVPGNTIIIPAHISDTMSPCFRSPHPRLYILHPAAQNLLKSHISRANHQLSSFESPQTTASKSKATAMTALLDGSWGRFSPLAIATRVRIGRRMYDWT